MGPRTTCTELPNRNFHEDRVNVDRTTFNRFIKPNILFLLYVDGFNEISAGTSVNLDAFFYLISAFNLFLNST